ncbi:MAG: murein hydrolase activator EnvC family protein [Nitrospinales bacterium]
MFCTEFFVVFPTWAGNKEKGEIDALINDEQKELQALKKKIALQEKTISIEGARESTVLKHLQKIGQKLKLMERELNISQLNYKVNQKQILSLVQRYKKAEQKLKYQEKNLGLRLRSIYKEGPVYPLKIMFSSNNVTDLLQKIKYMNLIARQDSELLYEYKNKLDHMNEGKRALFEARKKIIHLKEKAKIKKKEIERTKIIKLKFLKKIKKKKSLNIKTRKELVAASNNLNKLINKLLVKLVSGEGLEISDKKGRLKLPLNGPILNKFGRKRVKEYDSYIVYNGINVKATKGTHVKAVFDGKILFAGELEGYGNLVIIGHGNKYHSLYGHLDDINVSVNKVVMTGEIIGLSGDSGSLEGEVLYFELRKNGKPIQPLPWFRIASK